MKQNIIYAVIIILILSVLFVLFCLIKNTTQNKETKTETTYSIGKAEQQYKKGKDFITTVTKSFHTKVAIQPSLEDSLYSFTKSDSQYDLSISIKRKQTAPLHWNIF